MAVLTLIGAFYFCIIISFIIDNMSMFKISGKQSVITAALSIPIGLMAGFLLDHIMPEIASVLLLIYIAIPVMLIPFLIVYKSLIRAFMSAFYCTGFMLGVYSISRSLLKLLNMEQFDIEAFVVCLIGITAIAVLLQKIIKKRVDINILNNRIIHFILICAYATMVFIYALTLEDNTIFMDIAHVLFIISVAAMFIFMMRSISKEAALKTERLLTEASKKYINDLEESYQMLRTIKHDYVNILSTFKLYIDNKDVDGLAKYYYDELSEINKELLYQDNLINSLQNIRINEVKSILIFKCSAAASSNVDIRIEVGDSIESLGVSTAIVCQILGILLDNAVTATMETKKKKLYVAIIKNLKSTTFIIKNHWLRQDIPVDKLFEQGFSTKPGGSGMGLYTVRNYTQKISGLYLETDLSDAYFTQKLTVKDG